MSGPGAGGVLERVDAPISEKEAADVAHRRFGVPAVATRLPGERDQNFRLDATYGSRFVLKFSHSSENPAVVEFETAMLQHIARNDPALPVPRVVTSNEGKLITRLRCDAGHEHSVRLFTHLGGAPMSARPRQPAAFHAIGRMLARLHAALGGFTHAADSRRLQWDLQRSAELRPHLAAVSEPELRHLAGAALDAFEAHALPRLPSLPGQVIHNDLNPSNILFEVTDPYTPCGLLDFGDALRAPRIQDLAVAASYAFSPGAEKAELDAAAHARALVAGYQTQRALHPEEIATLPVLVRARLAMTTIITAWRANLHPANAGYILRNAPAAHAGLRALHSCPGLMQFEPTP